VTWATSLDRLEELLDMDDLAAVDAALVAEVGETVACDGREYDLAELLAGRLVERMDIGRCKTRGWSGDLVVSPLS